MSVRPAFWTSRAVRALPWQVLFVCVLSASVAWMLRNALDNLRSRGVAAGFDFLWGETSLPLSETPPIPVLRDGAPIAALALIVASLAAALTARRLGRFGTIVRTGLLALAVLFFVVYRSDIDLINYSAPGTYGLALLTALMNTIKVAVVAIVLCLLLGLAAGLCRISPNWLLSRLALVYVELMRNVPLLLHVFFWYFGVLRTLPAVRSSVRFADLVFLNNRGIVLAEPAVAMGTSAWLWFVVLAVVGLALCWRWWRAALPAIAGLVVLAAGLVGWWFGGPFTLIRPRLAGFNFVGGLTLTPEYAGLLIALVLYQGAFIAEIVRSAIQSVQRGQVEAALSLGLTRPQVIRLIILPQARRVAIPPSLTVCLGLIKDTSLGVAIGYPELVAVSGTILEVSGQVLEIILLIVLFYMSLTLGFSAVGNWYHARIRIPGT